MDSRVVSVGCKVNKTERFPWDLRKAGRLHHRDEDSSILEQERSGEVSVLLAVGSILPCTQRQSHHWAGWPWGSKVCFLCSRRLVRRGGAGNRPGELRLFPAALGAAGLGLHVPGQTHG